MSGKMTWERAAHRDRLRAHDSERREEAASVRAAAALRRRRQAAIRFAKERDLACFKCGRDDVMFAKSGVSSRGPWAICTGCVQKPRSAA
jgi:hypothetical protein